MKATQKAYNPEYSEDAPSFEEISATQGNVLLEFGAPWCSHCQASQAAAKEVLTQHSELPHVKLFDGKGKTLGRTFKVKLWPTFVLLHNGKEVERLVRPTNSEQISQLLSLAK